MAALCVLSSSSPSLFAAASSFSCSSRSASWPRQYQFDSDADLCSREKKRRPHTNTHIKKERNGAKEAWKGVCARARTHKPFLLHNYAQHAHHERYPCNAREPTCTHASTHARKQVRLQTGTHALMYPQAHTCICCAACSSRSPFRHASFSANPSLNASTSPSCLRRVSLLSL